MHLPCVDGRPKHAVSLRWVTDIEVASVPPPVFASTMLGPIFGVTISHVWITAGTEIPI